MALSPQKPSDPDLAASATRRLPGGDARSPWDTVAGEGDSADGELRRRLIRLMAVRTLVVSVVLGMSTWLIVRLGAPRQGATTVLLGLIVATYILTVVYAVLLKRGVRAVRLIWPLLVGDLIIATCLVYVTGAAQSAYTFFFALSIVAAGALRYRRGVVLVGLCSLALMVLLSVVGRSTDALPIVPWARPWEQSSADFVRALAQNAAAILAVGVLAYYLGDQLQRTSVSLARERRAVADLVSLHLGIVRSLPSGLITVDEHGAILSVNSAATEILAAADTDLAGIPVDNVLPGLSARLAALSPGQSLRRLDVPGPKLSGEQILGVSVAPLRDDQDVAVGWVVNFLDLTEMRALERGMRHAERMATLGELTAGIAHEIRNPLASISGSIELLSQAPTNSDDDRALMAIVTREVDRLNRLITDMLDYASPRPHQPAPLDLRVLVDETLRVFRQDSSFAQVAVQAPSSGTPVRLLGDPEKLRQVLWNLLRNAAEATTGRDSPTMNVELTVSDDHQHGRIDIRDNGAGIAESELARIFDPFFTTKQRGTGLGLPTCQAIVSELGGAITVDSTVGVGTTFTVSLPLTPE